MFTGFYRIFFHENCEFPLWSLILLYHPIGCAEVNILGCQNMFKSVHLFLTHSEKKLHKHFKKGIGGNYQFNNLDDIRDGDGCLYLFKSMSGNNQTVRESCLIFTRPFLLRN